MLLSGWATLVDNHALYNGEVVNSVEIAIGRNKAGERVKFFVISKAGSMFNTIALERYEIHRLHDISPGEDGNQQARHWLMSNVDANELQDLINKEKQNYFSMYENAVTCKRVAVVEFEDKSLNFTIGLKEFVTDEMLNDFYKFNTFKLGVKSESHECIGVTIIDK